MAGTPWCAFDDFDEMDAGREGLLLELNIVAQRRRERKKEEKGADGGRERGEYNSDDEFPSNLFLPFPRRVPLRIQSRKEMLRNARDIIFSATDYRSTLDTTHWGTRTGALHSTIRSVHRPIHILLLLSLIESIGRDSI